MNWMKLGEMKEREREEREYVVVEEVTMYSPVESVFKSTAIQNPNLLPLRRAPSNVSYRRC